MCEVKFNLQPTCNQSDGFVSFQVYPLLREPKLSNCWELGWEQRSTPQ